MDIVTLKAKSKVVGLGFPLLVNETIIYDTLPLLLPRQSSSQPESEVYK